jgi:hypothetical protein
LSFKYLPAYHTPSLLVAFSFLQLFRLQPQRITNVEKLLQVAGIQLNSISILHPPTPKTNSTSDPNLTSWNFSSIVQRNFAASSNFFITRFFFFNLQDFPFHKIKFVSLRKRLNNSANPQRIPRVYHSAGESMGKRKFD